MFWDAGWFVQAVSHIVAIAIAKIDRFSHNMAMAAFNLLILPIVAMVFTTENTLWWQVQSKIQEFGTIEIFGSHMHFTPIGRVVRGLQATETWQQIQQWQVLLDIWPQVVGKKAATKTRPLYLQRGILTVAVPNASWAQNLTFQRQRIVRKLQKQVQLTIRDIHFSSRDWYDNRQSWRSADSAVSIFQAHPSWVSNGENADSSDRQNANAQQSRSELNRIRNQQDAVSAFQSWSKTVQNQTQSWSVCPQCGCPVPEGELQRWSVCSICACQKFEQDWVASMPNQTAELYSQENSPDKETL
jgi:predicted nucleic acid-binding Zn ribbon protein